MLGVKFVQDTFISWLTSPDAWLTVTVLCWGNCFPVFGLYILGPLTVTGPVPLPASAPAAGCGLAGPAAERGPATLAGERSAAAAGSRATPMASEVRPTRARPRLSHGQRRGGFTWRMKTPNATVPNERAGPERHGASYPGPLPRQLPPLP